MKVFILPLLVAAASAQIIPTAYNGVYPGMVSPYLAGNQFLASPFVYGKPAEIKPLATMEYEKMAEKPMEKKMEDQKMEVQTYSVPNVFGQQVVYKQPILKQKVGVPARFHIKNGQLEHTSFTKREAEPVFPFSGVLPYTGYNAYNGYNAFTGYTGMPVAHAAPAVVPSVYNYQTPVVYKTPQTIQVQAPAIVKSEMEYLKPKVDEQAKTVANDVITPYMYADKGLYKAENAGAIHIAKREAEPFFPVASTYGMPAVSTYGVPAVSAYGMPAVASTYGMHAYGKVIPSVYHSAISPVQYVNPLKVKTFSDDRSKVENYAAKNQYHAENAGAVHIAKREAEPFWPVASNLGYTVPTVNAFGLNTMYNTPLVHTASPFVQSYASPLVKTYPTYHF